MAERYTKEEIAAFERKDKLNSRMSALKAAAMSYEGSTLDALGLMLEADKLYEWVTQDQTWKNNNQEQEIPEKVYPTPTNDQKQGLKEVEKATGWTKEQVWDKFNKYPVLANAHVCIQKIKDLK